LLNLSPTLLLKSSEKSVPEFGSGYGDLHQLAENGWHDVDGSVMIEGEFPKEDSMKET
jgi:hypothetical protein